MLWLKSRNSEVWLERRTGYTRSTAVMSMVGYLLGLGDRHPSNLMLDRYSGKLLHIDFGDCFEVFSAFANRCMCVPLYRLWAVLAVRGMLNLSFGSEQSECKSAVKESQGSRFPWQCMLTVVMCIMRSGNAFQLNSSSSRHV